MSRQMSPEPTDKRWRGAGVAVLRRTAAAAVKMTAETENVTAAADVTRVAAPKVSHWTFKLDNGPEKVSTYSP